jgi:hypothetical protein
VHDFANTFTFFLGLLARDRSRLTSAIPVEIERHTVAVVIWQDETRGRQGDRSYLNACVCTAVVESSMDDIRYDACCSDTWV